MLVDRKISNLRKNKEVTTWWKIEEKVNYNCKWCKRERKECAENKHMNEKKMEAEVKTRIKCLSDG